MPDYGTEITRFTESGKTFFFNKMEAKNGREYLQINGLWGESQRERLTLFPGQMIDFRKSVTEAIEDISNVRFEEDAGAGGGGVAKTLPPRHTCGAGPGQFKINVWPDGGWCVVCKECGGPVITTN